MMNITKNVDLKIHPQFTAIPARFYVGLENILANKHRKIKGQV